MVDASLIQIVHLCVTTVLFVLILHGPMQNSTTTHVPFEQKSITEGRSYTNVQNEMSISQTPGVAFYGKLESYISPTEALELVIFEKVLTNVDNDYSNITGIFSCPNDGLYLISVTLVTDGQGEASFSVFRQNDPVVYVETSSSNVTEQASSTAVLALKAKDSVYVKTGNIKSRATIETESSLVVTLLQTM